MSKNKVSPLNCAEIEKILQELVLNGSFVRNIIQPDFKTLVLELYQPASALGEMRLMIDLNAQKSSLYPLEKTDKVKKSNLRFEQMLRAHCKGGRLINVYQYQYQRIIVFHVKHLDEEKYLYVRLWAARSNIFLCDKEGHILDVFFRRPESSEISGGIFTLPSIQNAPKDYDLRVLEGSQNFAYAVRKYFYENSGSPNAREDFLCWYERQKEYVELEMQKAQNQMQQNQELMRKYQHSGDEMMAQLHNDASLRERAQEFYEKRKSLKQKNEYLYMRMQALENELQKLQRQYDLRDDEHFLSSRIWQKEQKSEKQDHSALSFVRHGITLIVGRSAKENDFLLRHVVKSHEWWLHVRDYAGCYVFVRTKKNQPLNDDVRLDACALAVHYSKAKNAPHVDIHCTQVKYLRRIKGEVGKVSIMREKPIGYRVDEKRLIEILNHPR